MRILVDGIDVAQSVHAQKSILLDTMILCYAHDSLNTYHDEASLIIKASISGLIKTFVSYQNLLEFYSVMTGKRVRKPLTSKEAAELCKLYEKSVAIGKLIPTVEAYGETFKWAGELSTVDGEVFDCVLAYTAKGNVDTIWTENKQHFKKYTFLSVENPLEWAWKEE